MQALEVGGMLTLNATTVFDLMRLATDEEDEPGQEADRNYWLQRGSATTVAAADDLLALVNEVVPGMELKYNKHYIGLARNGVADNFVTFRARREHVIAEFRIAPTDEVTALLDDAGLDRLEYDKRWRRYRVRLGQAAVARATVRRKVVTRHAVTELAGTPVLCGSVSCSWLSRGCQRLSEPSLSRHPRSQEPRHDGLL